MRRCLMVMGAAVAAAIAANACGGGPSDKDQATKVAVAYRRAGNSHDYAAEWNLSQPRSYAHQFPSAEEYTKAQEERDRKDNVAAGGTKELRYVVEVVIQEGPYYRVRVQVTDPTHPRDVTRSDVIVGKYGRKWLVAGSVEPGYPITSVAQ